MSDKKTCTGIRGKQPTKPDAPWVWDCRPFLYWGGTAAHASQVSNLIKQGVLGKPEKIRLPLISKIKEEIAAQLAAGGSRHTAWSRVNAFRRFYAWADTYGQTLTIGNVTAKFLEWCDHLEYRIRARTIKRISAYTDAQRVASVLDDILDLEIGLLRQTRIKKRGPGNYRTPQYSGLHLAQLFDFGHLLCDVCESLSANAIIGSLPILLTFRSGGVIEHWCGLRDIASLKTPQSGSSYDRKVVRDRRQAWIEDTSLKTRSSAINLRIKAEMLIFIAQTGMNLAQVRKLSAGKFSYQSHLDGYTVRHIYKPRREGQVTFEIYSEYRTFFERYLDWRRVTFPADEDLLFPVIRRPEYRSAVGGGSLIEQFHAIKYLCAERSVKFIGPSSLRKTRINWLARRSQDLDITAEMAQHTKQTLLRNYLQPDPQMAAAEISIFFQRHEVEYRSPGPGVCIRQQARSIDEIPHGAPLPDCISPAGCLFCSHQRDIDSEDHAWSLVTYRHLKVIELATNKPAATKSEMRPAAALVIQRITDKIGLFSSGSDVRRRWVEESFERIKEDEFHPMWRGFIELAELLL